MLCGVVRRGPRRRGGLWHSRSPKYRPRGNLRIAGGQILDDCPTRAALPYRDPRRIGLSGSAHQRKESCRVSRDRRPTRSADDRRYRHFGLALCTCAPRTAAAAAPVHPAPAECAASAWPVTHLVCPAVLVGPAVGSGRAHPGNFGRADPSGSGRFEEGIMHPMFVKLFLQTSEDDLLAEEEDRRRAANRARRTRSRVATRVVARSQDRRPPR